MKRKSRFRMVCVGALLLCWVGMYALGTDEAVPPVSLSELPDTQIQELSLDQEIRQTIDALLLQALDLPEERSQRLLETLHDARRIRQNYQTQREEIEGKLEPLLRIAQPDQAKIQEVLQELETTQTHYYQQVLHADLALWALLSAEEQAKYILFQRHFTQQLHNMITKIRQERLPTNSQFNFLLRRQDEESVIRQPR